MRDQVLRDLLDAIDRSSGVDGVPLGEWIDTPDGLKTDEDFYPGGAVTRARAALAEGAAPEDELREKIERMVEQRREHQADRNKVFALLGLNPDGRTASQALEWELTHGALASRAPEVAITVVRDNPGIHMEHLDPPPPGRIYSEVAPPPESDGEIPEVPFTPQGTVSFVAKKAEWPKPEPFEEPGLVLPPEYYDDPARHAGALADIILAYETDQPFDHDGIRAFAVWLTDRGVRVSGLGEPTP